MTLPPGLPSSKPNQVCRLLKSLYGLRQSSRQWYACLSTALLSKGFKQSQSDNSLFTKCTNSSFTYILVYVDDLILVGNNIMEITQIKEFLHNTFKIKDLGHLKYFLGLEIARSKDGIHLCQRKYALEILSDCGLLAAKSATTPMPKNTRLTKEQGTPLPDPEPFRRLIGKLIYLTTTRLDLSFAVQQLSQFMTAPSNTHYDAAIRVLRYVKSSPGLGLFFPCTSTLQLKAFSDSDWATCPDTR